jgi:hypothetical protein
MRYIDSVETYHRTQADVARLTGRPLDSESPSQAVPDPSVPVR